MTTAMEPLCTGVAAAPLKECPFCNEQAFTRMNINGYGSTGKYFLEAEIKCLRCKISITTASSYFYASEGLTFNEIITLMAKTINKWNTRGEKCDEH